MIVDHTWRPPQKVSGSARRVPPAERPCEYMSCRHPRAEHAYSVSRARELLGWEPRVDLDEGMRRTEAWFREEGLLPAPAG